MGQRGEALVRIWAFIWGGTVGAFITSGVAIVGLIWGVLDIVWQLITGWNTLSENSTPAKVIKGTLTWNVRLLVYSLTGSGQFEWLPSW